MKFECGKFIKMTQTAMESAVSISALLKYYAPYDELLHVSNLLNEQNLKILLESLGRELPTEPSEADKFKSELESISLPENTIWKDYITNLPSLVRKKHQARLLIQARNLILVPISKDTHIEIKMPCYEKPAIEPKFNPLLLRPETFFVSQKAVCFTGFITNTVSKLKKLIENSDADLKDRMIKLYLYLTPNVQTNSLKSLKNTVIFYNNCCFLASSGISLALKKRLYFMAEDILATKREKLFSPSINTIANIPRIESTTQKLIAHEIFDKIVSDLDANLLGLDQIMGFEIYNAVLLTPVIKQLLSGITNLLTSYEDIIQEESINWTELLRNLKDGLVKTASSKTKSELLSLLDHLNQVVFLLDCSLSDLEEAYADGNGPLSRYFSSSELRKFIRAIWSNNDKRAAMLEKIK